MTASQPQVGDIIWYYGIEPNGRKCKRLRSVLMRVALCSVLNDAVAAAEDSDLWRSARGARDWSGIPYLLIDDCEQSRFVTGPNSVVLLYSHAPVYKQATKRHRVHRL